MVRLEARATGRTGSALYNMRTRFHLEAKTRVRVPFARNRIDKTYDAEQKRREGDWCGIGRRGAVRNMIDGYPHILHARTYTHVHACFNAIQRIGDTALRGSFRAENNHTR